MKLQEDQKIQQEKLKLQEQQENTLKEINQLSSAHENLSSQFNEINRIELSHKEELEKANQTNIEANQWITNNLQNNSSITELIEKLIEEEILALSDPLIQLDTGSLSQQLSQISSKLNTCVAQTDSLEKKLSLNDTELQEVVHEIENQHHHNHKILRSSLNAKLEEIELNLQLTGI